MQNRQLDEQGFRRLEDGRVQIDLRFMKTDTILAWPTFDSANEMVNLAYRPYSREMIDRLLAAGQRYIFYTKQDSAREQYDQDLRDYLAREAYKGPRTISIETQRRAVSAMQEIVGFIQAGQIADFADAKQIVEYVLNDIHTSKAGIVNLLDIQSYDDYTYTHSLNVGTIAMVLAKRMNLTDKIMFNIGLAGFLHDIGKLRISPDIINKPGRLTEEEYREMKQHPRYGYEMVKDSTYVNDSVKRLILFHHEYADGTGYPLGLKYEKLGNITFLIAIADFYDALTTERSYKRALSPTEAMKCIMKDSVNHFPPSIVQRFMTEMKDLLKESQFFEVGMYVLLNTSEIARVVEKDHQTTTRPVIEVLRNSRGELNRKPVRVDLMYDGSRNIIKILEERDTKNLSMLFQQPG